MTNEEIAGLVDDLNYQIWENNSIEKKGYYFSYLSYTTGQCILFGKHVIWDSDHEWFDERKDLSKHILETFKDYALDLAMINYLLNNGK